MCVEINRLALELAEKSLATGRPVHRTKIGSELGKGMIEAQRRLAEAERCERQLNTKMDKAQNAGCDAHYQQDDSKEKCQELQQELETLFQTAANMNQEVLPRIVVLEEEKPVMEQRESESKATMQQSCERL